LPDELEGPWGLKKTGSVATGHQLVPHATSLSIQVPIPYCALKKGTAMSARAKENFVELCQEFENAMLVTQADNGALTARPMMIAQVDHDGDMWFATDQGSGKIEDILSHPNVCVTLAQSNDFASVTGKGEVIIDRQQIRELWSEPWRAWFPNGPDDPRIALIRVHASSGEFWSNSGTNRAKYVFEAAKAYLTGERPELDEEEQHARINLED
jgi:general stress protein 26